MRWIATIHGKIYRTCQANKIMNRFDENERFYKGMKKKLTLKKAKQRAWKAFSLWVRMSNRIEDSEVAQCYTCGKVKLIKELSAGHGIGGRNGSILFEERIVKPQCAGCNIFGRGQYQIFTRKLIDELGLKVYDEIVTQSRMLTKYTVSDLLEIEANYKKKLEEL